MTTFLFRSQLIFKMNTSGSCLNIGTGQLKRIQGAAKTSFTISDDWDQSICRRFALFQCFNLICSH